MKTLVSRITSYNVCYTKLLRAIRLALGEAAAGDLVLVAGKGHEDYQIIGKQKMPYSDRDTVRQLLEVRS